MKGMFGLCAICRWGLIFSLLLGITPLSQAANLGKTYIVDPSASEDEDNDHDAVFRTLAAIFDPQYQLNIGFHDTIVLKPGDHAGNIEVDVDGLTLKGEYGHTQTWLKGTLTINADQVTIDGLSIDAGGADYGLVVSQDDVRLFDVHTRLATQAGIYLNNVSGAQLQSVQVLDNASAGLLLKNSDGVSILNSVFQANGADGLVLERSDAVSVSNALFNLNHRHGLLLDNATDFQLSQSTFSGNGVYGVRAEHSARSNVSGSTFSGNNDFGMGLHHSDTFIVADNRFEANGGTTDKSGGLLLSGDSLENTIIDNRFISHSNPQAAGVWLLGTAANNRIHNNTFSQNHIGIGLDAQNNFRPENNDILNNRIQASQLAGIWSAGQDNLYFENVIENQNGPGIQLQQAEGERVHANRLAGNSQAGVLARRSAQIDVRNNTFINNGSGFWADHLAQSDVANNTFSANFGPGVRVSNSQSLTIHANELQNNMGDGIQLENSQQVDVSFNVANAQTNAGLRIESSIDVEVYQNQFVRNTNGLVVVQSEAIELRFNDFVENQTHGLSVSDSVVSATKNFWGNHQGPSGIANMSPSNANTAQGMELKDVFPWLSRPSESVMEGTVLGWFFETDPTNPWLYAPKLKVTLGLAGVSAQDGWISVYQPHLAPDTPSVLQHVAVSKGGVISGEIDLVFQVVADDLPQGVTLNELLVQRWHNGNWQTLESTTEATTATVRAVVALESLEDALFILGWQGDDNS